jgi:hypothetical protein
MIDIKTFDLTALSMPELHDLGRGVERAKRIVYNKDRKVKRDMNVAEYYCARILGGVDNQDIIDSMKMSKSIVNNSWKPSLIYLLLRGWRSDDQSGIMRVLASHKELIEKIRLEYRGVPVETCFKVLRPLFENDMIRQAIADGVEADGALDACSVDAEAVGCYSFKEEKEAEDNVAVDDVPCPSIDSASSTIEKQLHECTAEDSPAVTPDAENLLSSKPGDEKEYNDLLNSIIPDPENRPRTPITNAPAVIIPEPKTGGQNTPNSEKYNEHPTSLYSGGTAENDIETPKQEEKMKTLEEWLYEDEPPPGTPVKAPRNPEPPPAQKPAAQPPARTIAGIDMPQSIKFKAPPAVSNPPTNIHHPAAGCINTPMEQPAQPPPDPESAWKTYWYARLDAAMVLESPTPDERGDAMLAQAKARMKSKALDLITPDYEPCFQKGAKIDLEEMGGIVDGKNLVDELLKSVDIDDYEFTGRAMKVFRTLGLTSPAIRKCITLPGGYAVDPGFTRYTFIAALRECEYALRWSKQSKNLIPYPIPPVTPIIAPTTGTHKGYSPINPPKAPAAAPKVPPAAPIVNRGELWKKPADGYTPIADEYKFPDWFVDDEGGAK